MPEIYPTSIIPSNTEFEVESSFNTLISNFDSGAEQRRRLVRFAKRLYTVGYNNFVTTDRDTIHDFFRARFGAYESFWFLDFKARNWYDEYIGRGTGAALTIDLHTKTTTVYVIYVAGVLQVVNVDYTFVSGGGTAGVDRLTFIAGHYPAVGALITGNLKGLLRIKGRFAADGFKESQPAISTFHTFEISIQEVQW